MLLIVRFGSILVGLVCYDLWIALGTKLYLNRGYVIALFEIVSNMSRLDSEYFMQSDEIEIRVNLMF